MLFILPNGRWRLRETAAVDGVPVAGRFGPDGRVAEYKANPWYQESGIHRIWGILVPAHWTRAVTRVTGAGSQVHHRVDVLPTAFAAAVMHQDQRGTLEGPANV